MNYEKGLEKLEPYIPVEEKEDDRIDFDSLRNRLLQNMKEERRYGTTETLRNDRTRIIDGLNSLARRLTQMSFTDLSMGKTPPVMPPRSSSGAVDHSSSSSQPSQSEDTFLYDAFISYSSKDKEWVTCPSGAAACGAQHLLGNVWEWTTSRYTGYPAQSDRGKKDFAPGERDVAIRGGSWRTKNTELHCSLRLGASPESRFRDCGFRLVIAPALE
jgi:hypothetical protein